MKFVKSTTSLKILLFLFIAILLAALVTAQNSNEQPKIDIKKDYYQNILKQDKTSINEKLQACDSLNIYGSGKFKPRAAVEIPY